MRVSVREIAWIAGLLEGEGSFGFKQGLPVIRLKMTDEDIVAKAARILGVRMNGPYFREGQRPTWQTEAARSIGVQWMMTLLPLMGVRRSARIREVLVAWKAAPFAVAATCHPNRSIRARGLCGSCYNRAIGQVERRRERRRLRRVAHFEREVG